MQQVTGPTDEKARRELILTLAIPAVSFGGIGIALILQSQALIPDAGQFYWGCVAGAVMLGYLAYIKPRRDIVSLFAPVIAFLVFIMPLEINPNLLIQGLFAATITILALRLHYRFSTPKNEIHEGDQMEKFLYDYMHRISPIFRGIDRDTAHEIASVVLSFKFGLYSRTMKDADRALSHLSESGPEQTLVKALRIVKDRAQSLEEARVGVYSPLSFSEEEKQYIAMVIAAEMVEDNNTLVLDNALLFLYAVGYLQSPDDGQSLDEHQNFVLQIIANYREQLNLK